MEYSRKDDLEAINKELVDASEKLRLHQKLQSTYAKLTSTLEEYQARYAQLKRELEKEHKDYKRLIDLSLHSLFYKIFGNKAQQTEKERQEYIAALLKYEQCETEIRQLQEELHKTDLQIAELAAAKSEYEAASEQKQAILLSRRDEYSKKLLQNSEELLKLTAETKELHEAVQAGVTCLSEIKIVIDHLKAARGWGGWDMAGGGFIASAIKHGRVDRAKEAMHRAQHHLLLFNKELGHIRHQEEVFIGSSKLTMYADLFFDNIITDWVVQSRINKTLQNTLEFERRIQDIIASLQIRYTRSVAKQEELKKLRQELLETAG